MLRKILGFVLLFVLCFSCFVGSGNAEEPFIVHGCLEFGMPYDLAVKLEADKGFDMQAYYHIVDKDQIILRSGNEKAEGKYAGKGVISISAQGTIAGVSGSELCLSFLDKELIAVQYYLKDNGRTYEKIEADLDSKYGKTDYSNVTGKKYKEIPLYDRKTVSQQKEKTAEGTKIYNSSIYSVFDSAEESSDVSIVREFFYSERLIPINENLAIAIEHRYSSIFFPYIGYTMNGHTVKYSVVNIDDIIDYTSEPINDI